MIISLFLAISCVNGHAFGLGFLFALAHDFRIMQTEKGYMSLNAIDLGFSLHPG